MASECSPPAGGPGREMCLLLGAPPQLVEDSAFSGLLSQFIFLLSRTQNVIVTASYFTFYVPIGLMPVFKKDPSAGALVGSKEGG